MFDKQRNWFKILFWIFLIGTFITLYVDNVVKINGLVREIQNLKGNYLLIKEKNILLTKKLNERESPEYIIDYSINKLKMTYPQKAPLKIK